MVYLQVENLTKSYGERLMFEYISFGIEEAQRVALIAQNGMGKTTLMRILLGPDERATGSFTSRKAFHQVFWA